MLVDFDKVGIEASCCILFCVAVDGFRGGMKDVENVLIPDSNIAETDDWTAGSTEEYEYLYEVWGLHMYSRLPAYLCVP